MANPVLKIAKWAGDALKTIPRAADESRISTRFPTAVNAVEDPQRLHLSTGVPELMLFPKLAEHNTGLIDRYPGFHSSDMPGMEPRERAASYIDQAVDNLRYLYNRAPQEIRDRAPHWYPGVRDLNGTWATRYGVPPEAVAGVNASLSPQKDWFQNASLGERVLDIVHNQRRTPMTPEMISAQATQKSLKELRKPETQEVFDRIKGARYSDLEDPVDKALWVRLYDEAHNPRHYRVINPEGTFGDYATNLNGKRSGVAWGSLPTIGKAIQSAESGGNMDLISRLMGDQNKVRSFYNNGMVPHDTRFGDLTADTHAVAANQLRALSGNSEAVAHNFGSGLEKKHQLPGYRGPSNSTITGVKGTYGMNADAYRQFGDELGVLPREVQSVTWEAIRSLFPDTFKQSKKNVNMVDDIWRAKDAGSISPSAAREMIEEKAGGFRLPDWAKPGGLEFDPYSYKTYAEGGTVDGIVDGPTNVPGLGYDDSMGAPDSFFNTPPSDITLPPAQVYAKGGAFRHVDPQAFNEALDGRQTPWAELERYEAAKRQHEAAALPVRQASGPPINLHPNAPSPFSAPPPSPSRPMQPMEIINRLAGRPSPPPEPTTAEWRPSPWPAPPGEMPPIHFPQPVAPERGYSLPENRGPASAMPRGQETALEMMWRLLGGRGYADGGPVQHYDGGGGVKAAPVSALRKTIEVAKGSTLGDVRRWIEKYTQPVQKERFDKLESQADLSRFNESTLQRLFADRDASLLTTMPPGDFERFAPRLPADRLNSVPYARWNNTDTTWGVPKKLAPSDMTYANFMEHLKGTATEGGGFAPTREYGEWNSGVPTLTMGRHYGDPWSDIVTHNGRHRARALGYMGDPTMPVQLQPANIGELREPDVATRLKQMQEKYFPLGRDSKFFPQPDGAPRDPTTFPKMPFAEGGPVDDMQAYHTMFYDHGGAVGMNNGGKTPVAGVLDMARWLKRLMKDAPVNIAVPERHVEDIIKDGRFKTQFETGHSRGSFDPAYRSDLEHRLFGTDPGIDPMYRPIYGHLGDLDTLDSAGHYGDMKAVLHDAVKPRSTFTVGDSFGIGGAGGFRKGPFRFAKFSDYDNRDPVTAWLNAEREFKANAEYPPTLPRLARQHSYVETQTHGGVPWSAVNALVHHYPDAYRLKPLHEKTMQGFADMGGVPNYMPDVFGGHLPQEAERWLKATPGASRVETIPREQLAEIGYLPKLFGKEAPLFGRPEPSSTTPGRGVLNDRDHADLLRQLAALTGKGGGGAGSPAAPHLSPSAFDLEMYRYFDKAEGGSTNDDFAKYGVMYYDHGGEVAPGAYADEGGYFRGAYA